jgi:hypothetical protein
MNLDFNSIFIVGGASLVVLGGLIYWFLSKSEKEETSEDALKDLIPSTTVIDVIYFCKKYRTSMKKEEIIKKRRPKLNLMLSPTYLPKQRQLKIQKKLMILKKIKIHIQKTSPLLNKLSPNLKQNLLKLKKSKKVLKKNKLLMTRNLNKNLNLLNLKYNNLKFN